LQLIKTMKRYILLLCVLVMSVSACKKDTATFDYSAQYFKDDALLQKYFSDNKLTNVIQDPSGLYYQVTTQGNGSYPTGASTVTVSYTGKLLDGTVFDSNTSFSTPLLSVIRGWTIGLQHVKTGGTIMLYIPSGLGYGNVDNGAIPANSVLIFTITLTSIN